MSIVDEIRTAMINEQFSKSVLGMIPQVPHYADVTSMDSLTRQRVSAGYNLADPAFEFMGIKIYESKLCGQLVPAREHIEKLRHVHSGWMTGTVPARGPNYHPRIQKKWNKRFGFKRTPDFMLYDQTMAVVSRDTARGLRAMGVTL
jgi:hypothetical protein